MEINQLKNTLMYKIKLNKKRAQALRAQIDSLETRIFDLQKAIIRVSPTPNLAESALKKLKTMRFDAQSLQRRLNSIEHEMDRQGVALLRLREISRGRMTQMTPEEVIVNSLILY
ncbi:hypothetical protein ADLP2_088 [Acinetobacter phage vB_AbaM_DLP2]|nr:hypothetical protein ADLP2_088 [Acinetobacter phage vB_AbaM_DLP2]